MNATSGNFNKLTQEQAEMNEFIKDVKSDSIEHSVTNYSKNNTLNESGVGHILGISQPIPKYMTNAVDRQRKKSKNIIDQSFASPPELKQNNHRNGGIFLDSQRIDNNSFMAAGYATEQVGDKMRMGIQSDFDSDGAASLRYDQQKGYRGAKQKRPRSLNITSHLKLDHKSFI